MPAVPEEHRKPQGGRSHCVCDAYTGNVHNIYQLARHEPKFTDVYQSTDLYCNLSLIQRKTSEDLLELAPQVLSITLLLTR